MLVVTERGLILSAREKCLVAAVSQCLRGSRFAIVLGILIGAMPVSPVFADGVTIESEAPARSISITIENASTWSVLQALHDKFAIELDGPDAAVPPEPISMTLSGTLPSILERLLRNQNYMLVRSDQNVTGVAKILVLAASEKAPAKAPATDAPKPQEMP